MTHASQLSPLSSDYFSHTPRSFLSHHADFDEKRPAPTPGGPYTPSRGRSTHARQVGYTQPASPLSSSTPIRPRVPLRRTLLRLFILLTLAGVATLTWRCESVGCKTRSGGGALGGEYIGGGSVLPLEMPGVIKGWGTPEGVDLTNIPGWGMPKIWESPSWGGERQGAGMEKEEGSSTLDAFQGREGEEEKGELVEGVEEVEGEVHWDNEEEGFGSAEVGVVEGTGSQDDAGPPQDMGEQGEQTPPSPAEAAVPTVVKDTNTAVGDGADDIAAEGSAPSDAGSAVAVALIDAPPAVDDTKGGAETRSQDSGAELVLIDAPAAQNTIQQDDGASAAASFEQKLEQKGWLGSMGGLF